MKEPPRLRKSRFSQSGFYPIFQNIRVQTGPLLSICQAACLVVENLSVQETSKSGKEILLTFADAPIKIRSRILAQQALQEHVHQPGQTFSGQSLVSKNPASGNKKNLFVGS